MFKFHVVCAVLLVVCLAWTKALPVKEQGVEDLIDRLQQIKQLNDASQMAPGTVSNNKATGEKERSHLAAIKTKRSLNNSDRRTLLYQYYARGLAPMYDKRNFDEIDRYSKFNAKRSFELADLGERMHTPNKRQFDEIDRYANFNNRLGRSSMANYVKRNFDEIDRYGKFNKRPFRDGDSLDGNVFSLDTSQLADEMGVINEYAQ
ncbi:uncharacterized protein LOC128738596 [Sabethes cyaneus]|uniref:uncharacterized protein LOC128738596 n=1 Tax=Sabethes cyaneus TaxID=53552 RepID=UPI00237E2531|nr:uncharacterized protein LOC128738596 [Sabethes cyaneus]